MEAEEDLREFERSALENNSQFVSNVSGKSTKMGMKGIGKMKSFGAMGLITAAIVVFAVVFSEGNFIPDAISERLIEETDVQYADAVESKKLVFQQALYEGNIPDDTAAILKGKGVLVGYMDGGNFIEDNKSDRSSVLKMGGEIITADNFINKVSTDVALYNAFNAATYSRAAYYYDEAADKIFEDIGTNRDNYTSSSEFDSVMDDLVGKGSNVDVNTVMLVEKTRENENGEKETYYDYETNGEDANSKTANFISEVSAKNLAGTTSEATLNSADALKVADTVSKEQRSSLFYVTFMENISKMKAGEGNETKINEAMNYIYQSAESEVVDVKTGQIVKTTGTPLESPSLYAVLSGNKMKAEMAENYSSDRILKTIENQLGSNSGAGSINGTVASTSKKVNGSVGRFIDVGIAGSSTEVLNTVSPTVTSSLMNNSYETIKGINAGEFLVEGAVNVGKRLAKASGAAAGDATAAVQYARLNSEVLAMDAASDRLERSPFDITSKNTFLGSIFYKLAVASSNFSGIFSGVKTFAKTTSSSALSLLPGAYADETEGYLTTFGDCETYGTIGAVGSAQCAEIATFDPSTLKNTFNDPGFIAFVENNTTLSSSGKRTINDGSVLANYILYNDERKTPLGVMDGGIIDSLSNSSNSVPFVTDILEMIKKFLGTSDTDKRIASGAAFVNSTANPDWQTYKYAQRYVSLARATAALQQYSSDKTAYTNIRFFEGNENPVVAFLDRYYSIASQPSQR